MTALPTARECECGHEQAHHVAGHLRCPVVVFTADEHAPCPCTEFVPARPRGDCGTCNGSGIAPDHSPQPDDEQPCPECVP